MENYLILINKESKPVVIEVPEEPISCEVPCDWLNSCQCGVEKSAYSQIVQSAIADESKHIHFKNYEQTHPLLRIIMPPECFDIGKFLPGTSLLCPYKVGQTFQIPEGYSLRFEDGLTDGWVPSYNDPDNRGCAPNAEPCTYAILEKQEPKPSNSAHSFTEGHNDICIKPVYTSEQKLVVVHPLEKERNERSFKKYEETIAKQNAKISQLEEQLKAISKD